MIVISNFSSSHGEEISSLLLDGYSDLFWVSPYLAGDFHKLLGECDFTRVKSITLVTTLKANDQDQITKPKSLKSFYRLIKTKCPKAKVTIHIDNSLHGKIYIFKGGKSPSAIVTSANLTHNGFYNNHEWGVLVDDVESIEQLESEVLENIDYLDITESLVDRLLMFSDQYQRDNPDWANPAIPDSNILENVYNQAVSGDVGYYLKPIGVSENPIHKSSRRDFSELHQDLAFSKKGTGAIKAGDIVITTAVGCGCLLSYFQVTGSSTEATHEEKEASTWKTRWPWHIEGRNQSTNYGGKWWEYDLDRKNLLEEFKALHPDESVTKAGARTLGTLSFGSDKVEITKLFADFLIDKINGVS